jgi:UDP-glucose:(heptosyl)LPS alpha-1,3-glucosyltransferase
MVALRQPVATYSEADMHVALVHIRHAASGGVEAYLTNLARYLAKAGHAVSIICSRHGEPPHSDVRFVRLRPLHIGGPSRLWTFAKAVERHLKHTHYDVVYGLGKTWSHDVVRLGGGCHQTFLDLASGFERRSFPPSPWMWLKDRVALAIEARSVAPSTCKLVIANSEMVKRDVCARHGLPADHVRVIHNGVDGERFHPRQRQEAGARLRQECGFTDEHQVVLFLGSGYMRKGLDLVLRAFPTLLKQRPTARLLIVGYDSAQAQFQSLASELGIASATCFLGGRSDAPVCYGAADLYVLPTRYDPFANSTLEALASGLPVITSDTNGGSEVVTAEAGEVISYRELSARLGKAMYEWSDPQRLAAAREPARRAAERHPLVDKLASALSVLEALVR